MKTEYFDVEGVPVTRERLPDRRLRVLAWDVPDGRPFPWDSVFRNGTSVSKDEFDKLVEAELAELPNRPELLKLSRRNAESQAAE